MIRKSLTEFLADYTGEREVITLDLAEHPHRESKSPFIVVKHGDFAVVINPQGVTDHLSVDVHSFVNGEAATGGVVAMTEGARFALEGPKTGTTSHKWPSAALVAVVVGTQGSE